MKTSDLPSYCTDCYKVIQLKNGINLSLSSLDAKQLGMWICTEKKHKRCICKRLSKYGKVEMTSETYLRPKSKAAAFK